jgi:methyl-accepting chemotaxis protein
MTSKKIQFFVITGMGAVISVAFNACGLLFFKASTLPLDQLLIRGGIPALVFVVVYFIVLGRNAALFDPRYLGALEAGKAEPKNKEDEEAYRKGLEKIGAVPIKMIAAHALLQIALTAALVFPGDYLGVPQGIKTPAFLCMLSLGVLVGTFVYVLTDSLVSRSLIASSFTRYPRELREGRQALKMFIIPMAVTLVTLIFAAPVMILELNRSGKNLLEMQGGDWSMVLILFGAYVVIVFLLAFTIKKNTAVLYDSVILQLENLSSERKDLTRRVSICSVDELGTLGGMVNSFCENMSQGIRQIKNGEHELVASGGKLQNNAAGMASSLEQISQTTEQVRKRTDDQLRSVSTSAAAVNQIARNIESLEGSINTQASSMSAASAAVEEMVGNISSINSMTEKMVGQFNVLGETARNGSRIQQESSAQINEIVSQSEALQGANKTISTIAAQTNLLAMNAAIEAAHAGDAGKGFAVVADEIRKLAENSSNESHNISTELKQIVTTIDLIVKGSKVTEQAFAQVSGQIEDTQSLVSQVGTAIREQSGGADQVMQALKVMNDITAEVKTGAREMNEGNKSMLGEINSLQGNSQEISTGMETMSREITKVSEGAREVSGLAQTNQTAIGRISVIADGFEV